MENATENKGTGSRGNYLLPTSILVAAVLISGALIYSTGLKKTNDSGTAPLLGQVAGVAEPRDYDIALGDPNAPLTLVEYGDYQCPFCGRFFKQTEPLIREEYVKSGRVKMVWRDFSFLGPESDAAALSAHCAGEQGKFWEYHDAVLNEEANEGWKENNGNLSAEKLLSFAAGLGLNEKQFSECVSAKKYDDSMRRSYEEAVKLGVSATPTSFVGETKVEGAQPFSVFKSAIDKLLEKD